MFKKILLILTISLGPNLLSGCVYKGYEGPVQSDSKVTKLHTAFTGDTMHGLILFKSVDNKSILALTRSITLLPGKHTIVNKCGFWPNNTQIQFTLTYQFDAGKKYELICYDDNGYANEKIVENRGLK